MPAAGDERGRRMSPADAERVSPPLTELLFTTPRRIACVAPAGPDASCSARLRSIAWWSADFEARRPTKSRKARVSPDDEECFCGSELRRAPKPGW